MSEAECAREGLGEWICKASVLWVFVIGHIYGWHGQTNIDIDVNVSYNNELGKGTDYLTKYNYKLQLHLLET